MKQVASLRYGVIFKKAFCHPEIFTAFVGDFLGIEIEIDKVETEKSFDTPIGKVIPRFDLFAQDTKNRVIVDIQHARFQDHYDRFLHYHCVALLEQIASSKSYRPDLKVFTLVVLTSGDHHKKDISIIDFDPKDLNGNPIGEIPHKIIYICPKYVNDNTPEPFREWMEAILDSLDEQVDESHYHNPEIRKIFDYIEKDQISAEERTKMIDEYDEEELKRETFNKGKAAGIQEGLKEGLEKGLEKGLEEGLKLGKHERDIEVAKIMLSEGADISFISKVTGLSKDEILGISKFTTDIENG